MAGDQQDKALDAGEVGINKGTHLTEGMAWAQTPAPKKTMPFSKDFLIGQCLGAMEYAVSELRHRSCGDLADRLEDVVFSVKAALGAEGEEKSGDEAQPG